MDQANQNELIQLLKEALEQSKETTEFLKKQNEELTQTIANLNETVEYLKNKLFGASSEKSKSNEVSPDQQHLFNEVEAYTDPSLEEPTIETAFVEIVKNPRKKKRTRAEILGNFPIVEILYKLAPEDKLCSYCNTEMTVLGKKFVREEIRIIPAKIERIHYMQETLSCPLCKEDDVPVFKAARVPSPLLKHSLASPSIVTYVMYHKFVNYSPLYRQEKDLEQMGVKIPRGTLANWVNTCAMDYMSPIYEYLHKRLLEREFINADETICQVLKEDGKAATSKSYMWLYVSGNDGLPPIRLYEYQPGRSGDYPIAFLGDFAGYLCCDGYAGYNRLKNVTRCGCLAHMRRYWFEAIPTNRRKTKSKNRIPAEIGLEFCNQLFELEKQGLDLSHEKRKQLRLETQVPVWKAYWAWVEKVNPPGGSRLAKAHTYAKNQKPYMENYLLDGRCSISNNIALYTDYFYPHLLKSIA